MNEQHEAARQKFRATVTLPDGTVHPVRSIYFENDGSIYRLTTAAKEFLGEYYEIEGSDIARVKVEILAVEPTSQQSERKAMCPHCGWRPAWLYDYHLIPSHSFNGWSCPGSMQVPRNAETDQRPLWKDDQQEPTS